ncbi:MAG: hypothetical protein GXP50_04370 [Deltaproteobacteria bacterium]|nr:hypothetical protein [Deltaproteobacteria bacterium]
MGIYDSAGRLRFPDPPLSRSPDGPCADSELLVAQAYCPAGHPLIRPEHPRFRGHPAIGLLCRDDRTEGRVFLSPFGGDKRKIVEAPFRSGAVLGICCPHCKADLPVLAPHDCRPGASYVALFLTPSPRWGDILALCNVWGCPAAFLRRGEQVVAEFQNQILPEPGSA